MIDLHVIKQALRTHGFHKVAGEVLKARGEYVPEKWTNLEDTVQSVTFKMAANRVRQRAVTTGLLSLMALEAES